MPVIIGTGLQYLKWGMSGYVKIERHIKLLEFEQVASLMCDDIVNQRSFERNDVETFLRHPAICGQIQMLMGIPGFMETALEALHQHFWNGVPRNDEEIRSALNLQPQCCNVLACASIQPWEWHMG